MSKRVSRDHTALQIRRRTEISRHGLTASFYSVRCPRQRVSIAVGECEHCPQAQGLFIGRNHDLLLCGAATSTDRERCDLREAAQRTPVSSLMDCDIVCARSDVSLEALRSVLLVRDARDLPVVDQQRRAIGMVSRAELVRHPGGGTVAEIMAPIAFSVPEDMSIASAAALMASGGLQALTVADQSGALAGILSSADIADWVAQGAPSTLVRAGTSRGPRTIEVSLRHRPIVGRS